MEEVHADWKPVIYDSNDSKMVIPNGTMGQRWEEGKKWNLILENDDGTPIDPQMSGLGEDSQSSEFIFPYFDSNGNGTFKRSIPGKEVRFADGAVKRVATVDDVRRSQYGITRDGGSDVAKGYDDEQSMYTPAWQEAITSVKPELVTQIAREFAQNAIDTGGKSMIIMGAGINNWFNSDTIY